MPIYWEIVLWVVGGLIVAGFVSMLCVTWWIAGKVYQGTLVRTSKEHWGRTCSAPDNEEQKAMWDLGVAWAAQYRDRVKEVQIENDGLKLFGEYFDFGGDKCVIILPGRCESLMYSYFFAPPYQQAGFNVLVIDSRAHGLSDGKYNTIGVKESGDVKKWVRFACDTLGNKGVYLHGICVGTSTALLAMTAPDCPKEIEGLVTEGCYISFRETYKRHMIIDKRPLYPVLDMVMWRIRLHTGTNVYHDNPMRLFKLLRQRVLFIYGKQDVFSLPEKSQKLFDACAAEDKQIVWFEKGNHSHLRLTNTADYDKAIVEFVSHE